MGKLDNTLIIYIDGDNGTSPEGTLVGTPNQWTAYNGILDVPIADQLKFYDAWGSAATYPHMAVAWSWAFDTPFKWTKQIASHFGGTRQGLAISWPGHINDAGGIRTQFHHVIDIVPTILEATGIQAPEYGQRHQAEADRRREHGLHLRQGQCQCALDPQDPVLRNDRQPRNLPRRLVRQHDAAAWAVDLERAAAAPDDYKWELYNLTEDYSQSNDLAAKMPDKLKEMQALFDAGGGEVPGASAGQRYVRAGPRAAAEYRRRARRVHLLGRKLPGIPTRQRTELSWASRSRLPPRSMCRRAAATG